MSRTRCAALESGLIKFDPYVWAADDLERSPGSRILVARGASILDLGSIWPEWSNAEQGAPVRPSHVQLSADGRFTFDKVDYTTFVIDRATGKAVGHFDGDAASNTPNGSISATDAAYDACTIAIRRYRLPGVDADPPKQVGPFAGHLSNCAGNAIEFGGDRIAVKLDQTLALLDADSYGLVAGPVEPGPAPSGAEEDNGDGSQVSLARRPGHPDQVAVLVPGAPIDIWDITRGQKIASLPVKIGARDGPLGADAVHFDATGRQLIVVEAGRTIDFWDVDSARLARPPISTVGTDFVAGSTSDGFLITGNTSRNDTIVIQFWDTARGIISGSAALDPSATSDPEFDGSTLSFLGGAGYEPLHMNVDAQLWYAQLCTVISHGFTEPEKQAMPPGITAGDPCHD